MNGLLKELSSVVEIEEHLGKKAYESMVVFLFGRIFRYLTFDDILMGEEYARMWVGEGFDAIGRKGVDNIVIEFEAYSQSFDRHSNQEKCDLLVCWEDDWKKYKTRKCPVDDVLELKYFWKKAQEKYH